MTKIIIKNQGLRKRNNDDRGDESILIINNDYWVDKSLSRWKKRCMIVSAKCKITY